MDVVHNLEDVGHHLTGELQLTEAQRTAASLAAGPAEIKADHLPERVEAETARHDWIVLEMAGEEPEIRVHVEVGPNDAPAGFAARFGNFGDAVEHQHRPQWPHGHCGAGHLAPA